MKVYLLLILTSLLINVNGQTKDQNLVEYCVFNRTYNHEDIGVKIIIDGKLEFETSSINESFDLKHRYGVYLDTGLHVIRVESIDSELFKEDSVNVLSPTATHRIWIDYNHIPAPKIQFDYYLKNKFTEVSEKYSIQNIKDSLKVYNRLRLQCIEDQNRIIKDTIRRSIDIRWVYPLNE